MVTAITRPRNKNPGDPPSPVHGVGLCLGCFWDVWFLLALSETLKISLFYKVDVNKSDLLKNSIEFIVTISLCNIKFCTRDLTKTKNIFLFKVA